MPRSGPDPKQVLSQWQQRHECSQGQPATQHDRALRDVTRCVCLWAHLQNKGLETGPPPGGVSFVLHGPSGGRCEGEVTREPGIPVTKGAGR